ncbi:hypothetical protein GHYDROH2_12170 [Geobacter hydrogenophilus]|uniref:Uncharacterized protein n=1 Tax=Geobacter hydrogenophilus TaxID=40983 RepID=A0A9W6FZE3_9BACT|nr:hypothetical protein GHYDROH2_12170 [Geobacter hydrogenophilus]
MYLGGIAHKVEELFEPVLVRYEKDFYHMHPVRRKNNRILCDGLERIKSEWIMACKMVAVRPGG